MEKMVCVSSYIDKTKIYVICSMKGVENKIKSDLSYIYYNKILNKQSNFLHHIINKHCNTLREVI